MPSGKFLILVQNVFLNLDIAFLWILGDHLGMYWWLNLRNRIMLTFIVTTWLGEIEVTEYLAKHLVRIRTLSNICSREVLLRHHIFLTKLRCWTTLSEIEVMFLIERQISSWSCIFSTKFIWDTEETAWWVLFASFEIVTRLIINISSKRWYTLLACLINKMAITAVGRDVLSHSIF